MADVGPNIRLEKKRAELEKNAILLTIQRQELRLLEIEDEKYKVDLAIAGLQKNILDIEEKIAKMAPQ